MPDGAPPSLFVERFVEPYTGLPLVGVGGTAPPGHAAVDVIVDGEVVLTLPVRPADGHFAGHFPFEGQSQIRVAANDTVWHDGPIAALPLRGSGPPPKPNLAKRVKGKIRRTLTQLRELPEKVEYRLWKRQFRAVPPYETFMQAATSTADDLATMKRTEFSHRHAVSILCPVFNVDPKWLTKAVESVVRQPYPHWELCLADDASTNPATVAFLKSLVGRDPRIKVAFREANGHICHATNSALDMATGEYIGLLDNDDELAVDALFHVASALQQHPDADVIYSDEDKIDADGHRYDPQFKPDWSPDLLLSYNDINHFTVIRRSLVEAVGRYRPGFEGSQDHDLLLRVTERTDRVVHIPRVLYHWRSLPSSTAASAGVKQYVHDAGRKAVEDACRRRSLAVTVSRPAVAVELNLPILSFTGPDDGPTVSIVVTGTKEFTSKTSYRNFEIIANTDDTAAGRNRSAATATGDLLLFLDAELEPRDGDWLAKLVANLGPGVGVVGPRIHDVDGRIATAGIVVGLRDGCGPVDAFAGQRPAPASYYFYAEVTRNVSAVSGRCFLTRRAIFQQLGGFDDTQFPRTTWDVDYCLRANQNGSRNLYVGDCVMTFLPSSVEGERSTKIRTDNPTELLALRRRHGDTADPFHNPNFSRAAAFVLGDDPPWPGDRPAIPCLVFAHNLAAAEGAPRYLSDLIVGLTRKKTVIPTVLCGHGGAGEAAYRDHAIPVAIHDEPWKLRVIDGLWSRAEYRNAVAFFRNRLRAASPKLVIVNTLLGFPMIEAAARERIPTAWIIHESYSTAVRDRVFSPFAKGRCEAAFALADRIVPCSHDAAALVRHLDVRGRIRVRHNAIDPAELGPRDRGPRPPGPVRIIAVGTICERKGQHTLAEAAAILAKANLDFVVELIGARDGVPYLDYVRQLLRRRDVERFVKLIPETDAKPYFRSADIFACTSHMETYSRSILEAMAFGLPIVSTPCQGVGEQVVWGENALKFAAGDAGGLADCLRRLIADRQLRARMARASRDQFECHPPFAAMLDSFEDVFRFAMKR